MSFVDLQLSPHNKMIIGMFLRWQHIFFPYIFPIYFLYPILLYFCITHYKIFCFLYTNIRFSYLSLNTGTLFLCCALLRGHWASV